MGDDKTCCYEYFVTNGRDHDDICKARAFNAGMRAAEDFRAWTDNSVGIRLHDDLLNFMPMVQDPRVFTEVRYDEPPVPPMTAEMVERIKKDMRKAISSDLDRKMLFGEKNVSTANDPNVTPGTFGINTGSITAKPIFKPLAPYPQVALRLPGMTTDELVVADGIEPSSLADLPPAARMYAVNLLMQALNAVMTPDEIAQAGTQVNMQTPKKMVKKTVRKHTGDTK